MLRGYLYTLRNRLPVDEAAHLAAQLPKLLRGVYREGWRPRKSPETYHDAATFLDHLARNARLAGETRGRVRRRGVGPGVRGGRSSRC
jgi:uncharacterized protein (DUF2267 family)